MKTAIFFVVGFFLIACQSFSYAGDILVTPSDPWQDIVAEHDGSGVITFADGVYTAAGEIQVSSNAATLIAVNMGGATIVGSWRVMPGASLWLGQFNLKPPSNSWLMSTKNAWINMRDVNVDATQVTIDILVQTSGGVFRIDSRDRVSTWDIGSGITADVFDFDTGTSVKIVGNVTGNDVRFNVASDAKAINVMAIDQSSVMAAGLQMYAGGAPRTCAAKGIDVRRGSHLTFQDHDNRIQGFDRGITVRQNGMAAISGITLRDIGSVALWVVGAGKISYDHNTTSFSNNQYNTKVTAWVGNVEN